MTPAVSTTQTAAPRWVLRLPILLRQPRNPLVYWLYWAPFIAAYQLANRFPLREPHTLPNTWIDQWIPFVPELLPLYVAYLPLYWWVIANLDDDRQLNRAFYATHFELLVSLVFFVLLPTRMPRELFYPPSALGWADTFWRWFDGPNACFPSLHTSNCLMLMQFSRGRRGAWVVLPLLGGVIASTVLVKQHQIVDVLGGVGVYLLARGFLARVEVNRPGEESR